jgi:hypothetical protein
MEIKNKAFRILYNLKVKHLLSADSTKVDVFHQSNTVFRSHPVCQMFYSYAQNVSYWGMICIQLHFALSGDCKSSYICNRI